MNREEFDKIFEEAIAAPLVDAGFTERGKSLYRYKLGVTVGFVRLGGRMARTASAAWILGVRHPYVWTHTPEAPATRKGFYKEEFPLRFSPLRLMDNLEPRRYEPRYVSPGDYEVFDYAGLDHTVVSARLESLKDYLLEDFMPWAESLSAEAVSEQLRTFGGEFWVEKYWLKYYDSQ